MTKKRTTPAKTSKLTEEGSMNVSASIQKDWRDAVKADRFIAKNVADQLAQLYIEADKTLRSEIYGCRDQADRAKVAILWMTRIAEQDDEVGECARDALKRLSKKKPANMSLVFADSNA